MSVSYIWLWTTTVYFPGLRKQGITYSCLFILVFSLSMCNALFYWFRLIEPLFRLNVSCDFSPGEAIDEWPWSLFSSRFRLTIESSSSWVWVYSSPSYWDATLFDSDAEPKSLSESEGASSSSIFAILTSSLPIIKASALARKGFL